ncbi:ENTH domain-containing protein 1 [Ochotona princeps]|uniref:ENTH domain-containing protein 1 n=1 Tax=Ochotona princeps TaxID=9978 RepID=UPI0027147F29|nr:ENTH domain-containing protein 1 [Ochotona princeps]
MAFRRQMKNFVKNYSDAEIKVREATSNDPWGPSSSLMLDISDLTFNTSSLSEIMNMLWQRLGDHGKNWRHVYKSLTLMDYLIKNGSKRVIQHCREGFSNLHTLKDFQHVDEAGKDQGYYIREKSKQLMTLLMDEQLLHREREVASRTRRRTSCSIALPKKLPSAGNSPTACASAPMPENPASQKKQKLPKKTRLRSKKNAAKAGLKQEQRQDLRLLAGAALSQESLPLVLHTWESTEDLMLFYEDDPKPLVPAVPASTLGPCTCVGNLEEVCKVKGAGAVPAPLEKSPSPQTAVSLDQSSDSTITSAVTEDPLPMPPNSTAAAGSCETLTDLPTFWYSSKEEFISRNFKISKSDSTFYNQASVETLYVSPSFRTFNPMKEVVINKDRPKPPEPESIPMADENPASATRVPATSEGTASFSTFSVSSPELTTAERSVHLLPPLLAGPACWPLSQQQPASAASRDDHVPAKTPGESSNLSVLEVLPPNPASAKKETSHISSHNWVEFSTQNVDCFTSLSCSSFQTTRNLPKETEASNSVQVLLGEVRNAIGRLHEDLSLVIQELNVISSHLLSMSEPSLQPSTSSQAPLSSEGSSQPD